MVCITFRQQSDAETPVLRATGHAGSGDRGNDIVCAAVSILLYTFADAVEKVAGAEVSVEDFDEYRMFIKKSGSQDRLIAVTETILLGLSSLTEQYPEHVRLIIQ